MALIPITVDSSNYIIKEGNSFRSQKVEGGFSRKRQDQITASSTANVQWICDATEFDQLKNFYLLHSHEVVQIELIWDTDIFQEYQAYFIPGTFRLLEQSGSTYIVEVSLEIWPTTPIDLEYENIVVVSYNRDGWTDQFARLIQAWINIFAINLASSSNTSSLATVELSITSPSPVLVSVTPDPVTIGSDLTVEGGV